MYEAVRKRAPGLRLAGIGAAIVMAACASAAWADQSTNPRPAIDFAKLDYPAESQALREEGDVLVELCVGATGAVESVNLVRSSGYRRLDDVTVSGLKAAHFEPATRDGKAVHVCGYMLTMSWAMEDFKETDTKADQPPPAQ